MASDENTLQRIVPPASSSLSPINNGTSGKQTFRSVGLYITANAGFRKCMLRNRPDGIVDPLTLEDLLEIPEKLVPKHRDTIQPKMSYEMKNALSSLNKSHLMEEEAEKEIPKDDNQTIQRAKSLYRPASVITRKTNTTSKLNKRDITDTEKGNNRADASITDDFVLPKISGISPVTEHLLLRNKKLEKYIENLKLQHDSRRTGMLLLSRSMSDDQEGSYSLKPSVETVQNKALPSSRKLSVNSHRSLNTSAEDESLSTLVSLKHSGNRRMKHTARTKGHSHCLGLGNWCAE